MMSKHQFSKADEEWMNEAYEKVAIIVQKRTTEALKTQEVDVKEFAALLSEEERDSKRKDSKQG